MDTVSLVVMHHVLRTASIRGAARHLARAAGTVAACVDRVESAIAVALVHKTGNILTLTLEGTRLASRFAALAEHSLALEARTDGTKPGPAAIRLTALMRLGEVARTGSIRQAAQAVGIGQPQLTHQIARLERDLGRALLVRTSRGATLTPEGESVLATARDLLACWSEIAAAAADRFRRRDSTMRLGTVIPLGHESALAQRLARLAADWRSLHPRRPLYISSHIAEDLLAGLRTGAYDVALLDSETVPADFASRLVSHTPLTLVGTDLSRHDTPGEILAARPLAVPSLRSGLRQAIGRVLDDVVPPMHRDRLEMIEIDSIPLILNLVMAHGFASILPESAVAGIEAQFDRIRLHAHHDIGLRLAWPRRPECETLAEELYPSLVSTPSGP